MSGILAAIRLEQAGIPYTVVEKNPAVGGTWYENRYPGCRVDVANHFYSYSFEPNEWVEFFSQRPELFAYFDRVATDYGVRPQIRFEREVVSARWDDERRAAGTCGSASRAAARSGSPRTRSSARWASSTGRSIPEIPGRERFAGASFHSAEWDEQPGPHRQARGGDRHGRERLPARARGREAGGEAHRLPALARRG